MLRKSFTITEMVVVCGIIAILASVVFILAQSSRAKARDTRRIHDLQQVEAAINSYKMTNGKYPDTGSAWWGSCQGANPNLVRVPSITSVICKGDTSLWISGLFSETSILPKDPNNSSVATANPYYTYLYKSNGYNYKLMVWKMDSNISVVSDDNGVDPARYELFSPGAQSW